MLIEQTDGIRLYFPRSNYIVDLINCYRFCWKSHGKKINIAFFLDVTELFVNCWIVLSLYFFFFVVSESYFYDGL